MSLVAVSPVPIVDLLELYDPLEAARRTRYKAAIVQAAYSETFGVYEAGRLLLAVGFLPLEPEASGEALCELWFVCRPEVAPYLLGLRRLARLTLARVAESGRTRIRAYVRRGHRPGERLARVFGLERAGIDGSFERWEWAGWAL